MTVTDIGILKAFTGGFSSFFSVWQLCLMQISPFFLSFAAGLYAAESRKKAHSPAFMLFIASLGYSLGFSILFSFMGVQGAGASGYILYYIEDLRMAAGIYIGMTALFIPLSGKLPIKRMSAPYFMTGILLGLSFALSYSPCITPVMSEIMNFAAKPSNTWRGFILLSSYGVGLSTAFSISGIVLSLLIGRYITKKSGKNIIIAISSGILLIMSALLFTDLMITYKSFLVGLVLD